MPYVYYSVPAEGCHDQKYVIDISNESWNTNEEDRHLKYRNIFPGSIIHCRWFDKKTILKQHTGIKYHKGER